MSYLKTLNESNIPIVLDDEYINVKDRTIIVVVKNICDLYYQGRRCTCVICQNLRTKKDIVYELFNFVTSFAEYTEDNKEIVIDEDYNIHSPENVHDNYNFS